VNDPDLAGLESDEGWLYSSSRSVGVGDPGRFHALFGRDSLISSLQLLPVRPDIARAMLRALARRQGHGVNPVTLEEPGKIGHEFRPQTPPTMIDAGWPGAGRVQLLRHRRRHRVVSGRAGVARRPGAPR